MAAGNSTPIPWRVDGPTTLHGYDDDSVYMLVCADTDDPDLWREVALVATQDLEGEGYARIIAAVPRLLAACRAVVERWEQGDLAEAAQMCAEAVRLAMNASASDDRQPATFLPVDRNGLLQQLVEKAEAAGLEAEDLDETVHELAASIAADINNEGLQAQLGYLLDEWGGEAIAREIDRLIDEKSTNSEDE